MGAFRIQRNRFAQASGDAYNVSAVGGAGGGGGQADAYFEALLKLIPTEIISLYLVGDGVIPKAAGLATGAVDTTRATALTVWTLVCLVFLIALRAWGTADRRRKKPPQWGAVAIAAVSFLIWVYNIGGPFREYPKVQVPYIGSLILFAWTFFVPFVYRGESDDDAGGRVAA